ncbi:MAG: carboxypeptidase regulatory-like domain-containing protein [Leptolyngbya sp.]|nr:carboxypeptidase regulatory-like domain-containing protein [Candidatus Melainabacteria bacterium]
MNTLQDKLAKILSIKDERACAESFESFCQEHAEILPMPGENSMFDKAMWAASKFTALSKKDEAILSRVTGRLVGESVVKPVVAAAKSSVLNLKELVGSTKETAIGAWQDMLSAMSWQQMVPAGAMRGVGTQMVSLGTFQKQLDDANVQVNLGWLVDKDQLRVLLQAKDKNENALSDVEVRITETERGVVFSRKTNEDGSVVAPSVQVGPGQYQIQVIWLDKVVETPFFKI